jgi:glutamate/tyrosine decarboxylase-like PLP-dependent enzyme
LTDIIDILKSEVDPPGINAASGGHLGYIPGGGIYTAGLGDWIAAVTNHYAGIFFGSPGAVRMEHALIREIADWVGYPSASTGNLASGGSMANMVGVVSARQALQIDSRNVRKSVVYSSTQAHHCLQKAFRIVGLGEMVWRDIPLDKQFRMRTDALQKQIEIDMHKGLTPSILLAAAGSTDTGAIDPLDEMADLAEKHKMWFHIDAAYGGFFSLLSEEKHKFKGMERSDSLVLDPHKGLFLPYGLGVVLVRHASPILAAHHYRANYMQDAQDAQSEYSPADLSPELTKHFRAMRLWLPLRLHGLEPFLAQLREKRLLARYLAERLPDLGYTLICAPELSVVTFHWAQGPEKNWDMHTRTILTKLEDHGQVFLSSTRLKGHFVIRAAILSFRTHLGTLNSLIELLRVLRPS